MLRNQELESRKESAVERIINVCAENPEVVLGVVQQFMPKQVPTT